MKREFSVFENGRYPYQPHDYGRLAGLTIAIFNEPQIAPYIEVLRILDWCRQWPESMTRAARMNFPIDYLGDAWYEFHHGRIADWDSRARHSDFYASVEYDDAKLGDEIAPLQLLLPQLPNLRILELNISRKECYNLSRALELIQQLPSRKTLKGPKILTKLETIILTDNGQGQRQSDIFRCVLSLPSARIVQVTGLQLDNKNSVTWMDDYPGVMDSGTQLFNVAALSLLNFGFHAKTMYSVLNCMTRLKHFSCVLQGMSDPEVDPYWIRAGLESKSKDTLESLKLVGYHLKDNPDPTIIHRPWHFMGSLRNFSVLKSLTINTGLTEYEDESGPLWFPISFQTITFHAEREGTRNTATNRIKSFLLDEAAGLPHLGEINVTGTDYHDFNRISDFWDGIRVPHSVNYVPRIFVPDLYFLDHELFMAHEH